MQHWNNATLKQNRKKTLRWESMTLPRRFKGIIKKWLSFYFYSLSPFCQWAMLQKKQSFSLTALWALCRSEAACRKSHTSSICSVLGALFLGVSRASLEHSVHGEGVTCPPLDLVASWPSLSPGLQGHVLAATSVFCLKKREQEPFLCQLQLWWTFIKSSCVLAHPTPILHPPDKTFQSSLQRSSKTDW